MSSTPHALDSAPVQTRPRCTHTSVHPDTECRAHLVKAHPLRAMGIKGTAKTKNRYSTVTQTQDINTSVDSELQAVRGAGSCVSTQPRRKQRWH